jgi:hypothetical protein
VVVGQEALDPAGPVSTSTSPASTASKTWRATSAGLSLGASPASSAAISVSTKPAWTPTTSVPWRASSIRTPLVSAQAAALDAP